LFVPIPAAAVMLVRSYVSPALRPCGLLTNDTPTAPPTPIAGSVIGTAIGTNPYFLSRKLLMSGQPSSEEFTFDGFACCACWPATATAGLSARTVVHTRTTSESRNVNIAS
jgi:hypothetical protein